MTLNGAIKQLHELRSAEDMPFYYKPAIAEVINVLLMDTQEVRHGRWLHLHLDPDNITGHTKGECSICGKIRTVDNYCPNCGAKMDEVEKMSVLVKGMKMPKSCGECFFYDGGGCFVTMNIVLLKRDEDKPEWCPLVELPELLKGGGAE